jgi:hypothetical protein
VRALLREQPVVGTFGGQQRADRLLGGAVRVRHRVGGGRLAPEPLDRAAVALEQFRAGRPGGPFREFEVLVQKIARTIRTIPTTTAAATAT